MSADWKGEHLISAKPSDADRKKENSRMGCVLGKMNGSWHVPLSARIAHGNFVAAALGVKRRDNKGQ